MNWADALAALKLDKRIAREIWPAGSYLMLFQPSPANINGKFVTPPKQVGKIAGFNEALPTMLDNGVTLDLALVDDIFRNDWKVIPNPNLPSDGATVFNFGEALRRLSIIERTVRIAKADWAPGTWVILVRPASWATNTPETSEVTRLSWLGIKTPDGSFGPWSPSYAEMQSTNWKEVT